MMILSGRVVSPTKGRVMDLPQPLSPLPTPLNRTCLSSFPEVTRSCPPTRDRVTYLLFPPV